MLPHLPRRSLLRRSALVSLPSSLLSPSPRRYASVNSPDPLLSPDPTSSSSVPTPTSATDDPTGTSPAQRAINANRSPNEHRAFVELKRERKLKEYEKAIQAKALSEGITVSELKARVAAASKAKSEAQAASNLASRLEQDRRKSEIEQRDERIAAEIRKRAEAEAKRKLESGELGSGPGSGKGPKPLSSFLDVGKLSTEDVEKVTKLWTTYHSLKNKLSSVIPLSLYSSMIQRAKRYPSFVLPLPRTVTVGDEVGDGETEGKDGGKEQGYEMYYLEWGFLPPPPLSTSTASQPTPTPTPCTVLFTPLAEYKLRQEFAQPTLVLTFYVDLCSTHRVVLMRGDVTGEEEVKAVPTAMAAAMSAASKGASQEEVERLKAPLQSQGKVSQQDAQLLVMALQRFYMPPVLNDGAKPSEKGADARTETQGDGNGETKAQKERGFEKLKPTPDDLLDPEARERLEILQSFHLKQDEFDLARLCKTAFLLG